MSFIEAQFKYCLITWMFCSRSCDNTITKLQERALRLIYDDYESSCDVLFNKNKSFSIHHQNIQKLMIEVYKFLNKPYLDNFLIQSSLQNGDKIHSRMTCLCPL